ncbi:hypothetical protein [Natrononativus amylolyticus]|uniref:hypothetical protein n=1 Tax=Natrononativus amylolyticus TaxID=2963434 RepID=UPI0020CC305F|nr:hypothetical protein [Natrononativus amylolyticus]
MSLLDRVGPLRQPQYTGSDRCWPCTLGNVAFLVLLSLVVAPVSVTGGGLVLLVGGATIWLRGYLVPYTPQITAALFERRNADPTRPEDGTANSLAGDTTDVDGEVLLSELAAADVLDVTAESVALTDEFRDRWDGEIAVLREYDHASLASAVLEASPVAEDVDVVDRDGQRYVVLSDGTDSITAESWVRRPNALAQTAAVRTLAAYDISESRRASAAYALGLFLTHCPACEAALTDGIVGGCCGPPQTAADGTPKSALTCNRCQVHLHVFE